MLGLSIPSTSIILFNAGLEVEASAASSSAEVLSPPWDLCELKLVELLSDFSQDCKVCFHSFIFASYFPWNWLATNCESLKVLTSRAPTLIASRNPAIRDLYSALNFKRNDCSIISPVGASSCIPIPDPCFDDAPSICNLHFSVFDLELSSFGTSSMTKSASTCAFELVRGLYSMSYSLSSIAHFASLPDWLGL